MSNKHMKNIVISTYKLFVYFMLYSVFILILSRINYALLSLTRTFVITTSTFFLSIIMMMTVYGNFRIGIEKSKPVFLSTMITLFITNVLAFSAMVIMGINQFSIRVIIIPGVISLVLTYIVQGILTWIFAHLGNTLYFKLHAPVKTIIIDNNDTLYQKIHKYVASHDMQYKLTKTYYSPNMEDINFEGIEHIYLLNDDSNFEKQMVEYCYYNDIHLTYNANTFNILIAKRNTVVIDDVLMIEIFPVKITFLQLFIKRAMDVLGSLALIVITSPVFIITAIAIKLDDGGPVIYTQDRLTKDGKIFQIYKFRSMKTDSGNVPVQVNDSRITNTGEKIRKYRIDELPQMFNILKGDMSLVGPRPESVAHSKIIKQQVPEFNQRLKVKAGLTGYAQIFGKYNTTPKMKLRLDLKYIESFSVLDDIRLLLQTLIVFIRPDSTEAFDESIED